MRKKTLRVRGLFTPRWILWVLGWAHGHIFRSGGIDPNTKTISSCYITGKCFLFQAACITRVEALERTLQSTWVEADRLLVDHAVLCAALAGTPTDSPTGNASAVLRAKERAASARAAMESRRLSLVKDLLSAANHIHVEEQLAIDQIQATAEGLKSTFSAYGHGLTLRPIHPNNLPTFDPLCFAEYRKCHSTTMEALDKIVKEAIVP